MKILTLSLDPQVAQAGSPAAERARCYGSVVERYAVVVPFPVAAKMVELDRNVSVYGIPTKAQGGNGVGAGMSKMRALRSAYRVARDLMAKEKYDIVSVQDPYYLGLAALMLARKFGAALEVQVHGFEKAHSLRVKIAKYVLTRATAVRCVSDRMRKILENQFRVDPKRISVVHIYAERFDGTHPNEQSGQKDSGVQKSTGVSSKSGDFIFLTVSRLVPIKNISLQLQAIARLAASHSSGVSSRSALSVAEAEQSAFSRASLWIAGDGPERQRLEMECDKLGIASRVRFFGQLDHQALAELYHEADAFLLTSNSEGWGMAVVEAAQFGLPIIMTDVGCAGEFAVNTESALIISVGDVRALEQAMTAIIRDAKLRKDLCTGARAAADRLPSKEQTLASYRAAWEKALALK